MRFLAYASCLLMTLGLFLGVPVRGESRDNQQEDFGGRPYSSSDNRSSENRYSTIFTILNTQNFLNTLEGPFTIFIPSNSALLQLSPLTLRELSLPENEDKLSRLVANHVVRRQILRQDFEKFSNREIKSLGGRNLTLKSDGNVLTVDGARILRTEAAGENGVLYVIDRVLWP